jgi:hypothetical protein
MCDLRGDEAELSHAEVTGPKRLQASGADDGDVNDREEDDDLLYGEYLLVRRVLCTTIALPARFSALITPLECFYRSADRETKSKRNWRT